MDKFPTNLLHSDWEGEIILAGRRGSHAWGVATEDSDVDWWAVWVHPIPYYLGLRDLPESNRSYRRLFRQAGALTTPRTDLVVYDVRRFIQLLSHNNPEAIRLLWTPPAHLTKMTRAGRMLLDNRKRMISQEMAGAFWAAGSALHSNERYDLAGLYYSHAIQLFGEERIRIPSPAMQESIQEFKRGRALTCKRRCDNIHNTWTPDFRHLPGRKPFSWYDSLCQRVIIEHHGLTLGGNETA